MRLAGHSFDQENHEGTEQPPPGRARPFSISCPPRPRSAAPGDPAGRRSAVPHRPRSAVPTVLDRPPPCCSIRPTRNFGRNTTTFRAKSGKYGRQSRTKGTYFCRLADMFRWRAPSSVVAPSVNPTPSRERICLLTGGGYPYRRDALGGWCRTLVEGLRRFRFELLTVTDRELPSAPAYPLPFNVGSARAIALAANRPAPSGAGRQLPDGAADAATVLCRGLLDETGHRPVRRRAARRSPRWPAPRPSPLTRLPLADRLVDAWRAPAERRTGGATAAEAERARRADRGHPAAARPAGPRRAAAGSRPGALRRRDHAAARPRWPAGGATACRCCSPRPARR